MAPRHSVIFQILIYLVRQVMYPARYLETSFTNSKSFAPVNR
jgi:hypothetical protein